MLSMTDLIWGLHETTTLEHSTFEKSTIQGTVETPISIHSSVNVRTVAVLWGISLYGDYMVCRYARCRTNPPLLQGNNKHLKMTI